MEWDFIICFLAGERLHSSYPFPLKVDRSPRLQVEAIVCSKHMERHIMDAHDSLRVLLQETRIRNASAVHDIHSARSNHPRRSVILNHNCGIFINAEPQVARVLGHGTHQPSHASAFREMRVDDNIGYKG